MIASNVLRSKIGFAQVRVKGIWKLYWMGQLILDGKECKVNSLNNLPVRQWVFKINTLNGEKKVTISTSYDYEEGFAFKIENFYENLSHVSSLELRALYFQLHNFMRDAINNNYRKAA